MRNKTIFILFIITAWRVWFLMQGHYDLFGDEAQYWTWAQTPDFGYYSKPPMIAWAISLTTYFFGNAEWAVRLSAPITHTATAFILFFMGKKLYNEQIGFWSAITYILIPAVTLSSAIISTDIFLLFFWAACLYAFTFFLEKPTLKNAILTGTFLGLGLLSKYTMLFCGGGMVLYAITTRRDLLHQKNFYVMLLVGAMIFMPNIYWNAVHDFVSIKHTGDNANLNANLFNFDKLAEFIGAQFAVFGPIIFATLLYILTLSLSKGINKNNKPTRLLLHFIGPLFAVMVIQSFLSRANANWAAPIYIAATLLVCAHLATPKNRKFLALTALLHIFIGGLFYHYEQIKHDLWITAISTRDPFERMRGWHDLGNAIKQIQQQYPDDYILSDNRMLTASLFYELRPFDKIVKWNFNDAVQDHYEMTTSMHDKTGKDFLLVSQNQSLNIYRPYFDHIQKIKTIMTGNKTFHIYRMQRYKNPS